MNRSSPFDAFIPSPEHPPVAPDFTVATNSDLPIIAEANLVVIDNDCWNKIGVKGDRSCSELPKYVHCRNCPVFTAKGQRLFERDPPPGHLAEWTKRLAEPEVAIEQGTVSVLVFRIGEEWMAADIALLVEIGEMRPIHTIPHRTNEILSGLVNIRGELELCVSLGGLLGIKSELLSRIGTTSRLTSARDATDLKLELDAAESGLHSVAIPSARMSRTHSDSDKHQAVTATRTKTRLLVVSRNGKRWVFQVDEVEGVTRFSPNDLTNVPSTVSESTTSFTKGVFWQHERRIGYLDEARLFETLERSLK